MKKLIVALAVVSLIGGCVKMDKTPPKDMPAYVTIYPGGQPMMTMKLGPMSSEVFTTTATPDQVISYYRSQAASDGLPENATHAANANPAQQQVTFGDPSGDKMLVVVAQPQGASTLVNLTYKPATAQSSS